MQNFTCLVMNTLRGEIKFRIINGYFTTFFVNDLLIM